DRARRARTRDLRSAGERGSLSRRRAERPGDGHGPHRGLHRAPVAGAISHGLPGRRDGLGRRLRALRAVRHPRTERLRAIPLAPWAVVRKTIEVIELCNWGPDREHLEREALLQTVETRFALDPLLEWTRQPLLDLSMPVHELSPQGHVLKPTVDRMSARQVRLRNQATIGFETVKPR